MPQPRRFQLHRHVDHTGVSGTGTVADGVQWPDQTVTLRWRGPHASTVIWASIDHALAIHGHDGATTVDWLDPEDTDPLTVLDTIETAPRYTPAPGCPHCPDGHTPPDHGQPWHVRTVSDRSRPNYSVRLVVERSAGAHVAESDAQWLRDLIARETEA